MGDDITIGVTEIINNIEVTAQPNDQIVDISVIDNTDEVTLNITPTVIEINVNKGSSYAKWGTIIGTLTDQSDLVSTLALKADLVAGKVPSSQLPSYVDDVIEVANYAALPTTGETGKIYITINNNHIFRWTGSTYVEITDNTAVWGAITGTLSSQSDLQSALNTKEPTITSGTTSQYFRGDKTWQTLDKNTVGLGNVDNTSDLNKPISTATQNALNGKFNNPTGNTTQYIAGDGSLITFPISGQAGTIVREVRNTTGATLTKGTIVYISGATGNKPIVSKAIATGDSTSAQTFGFVQADIANNANGYVVTIGDLIGLDTSAITEGTQLYLSSTTAGTYTTTKQIAPAHLVYVGIVTRSHPTQGQIEVKVQNGYELDEIHDVLIISKTNKDFLNYDSASGLWKNKSLATILAGSSSQFVKGDGTLDSNTYALTSQLHNAVTIGTANGLSLSTQVLSLGLSSSSTNGALSSTDWTTFNSKQGALNGTGFVKVVGTTVSYDDSVYALDTAVVKLTGDQAIAGIKTFSSDVKSTAFRLTGGTTGTGLYYGHTNKVVLANYTVGGGIDFETNGGSINMVLDASGNLSVVGSVTTSSIIKAGGTSTQFLKADGSVDNSTYYLASNPNGYTSNLGTVTSVAALTLGTTGTDISSTVANGSTTPVITLNIPTASATNRGALSSTDWNTFNNKISGSLTNRFIQRASSSNSLVDSNIYENSTGNIGINTTSPFSGSCLTLQESSSFSAGLSIKNRNSTQQWDLVVDAAAVDDKYLSFIDRTNGQTRMAIGANGNVGIGTTSPGTTTNNTLLGFVNGSNIQARTAVPQIAMSANIDGDWYSATYKTSNYAAQIYVDGNGGTIGLRTAASGTAGNAITWNTPAIFIQNTNNVGIGTTSPLSLLQVGAVASGTTTNSLIYLGGYNTTTSQLRYIMNQNATGNAGIGTPSSGGILFGYGATDGTITGEWMRITPTGNVGIGTTSPSALLHLATSSGNGSAMRFESTSTNGRTYGIGSNFATGVGEFAIYDYTANAERMRITSNGNVGIGTTSPNGALSVKYNPYSSRLVDLISDDAVGNATFIQFNTSATNNIGSIARAGFTPAVVFNTTSDYRLKEDFKEINGLDIISKIKVYDFKWKGIEDRMDGVIAHELQEIIPYAVTGEKDAEQMQSVDYSKLVPILVQAIKELKTEIDLLKQK